ncbi:MAG: extracellular solute-binding protein [Micromonosporaceae bacterium]|nr:extracellular solute-binding protein [Micromonosporaceae bacterium]
MQVKASRTVCAMVALGLVLSACGGGDDGGERSGGTGEPEASMTFAGPGGELGDVFKASIADFTAATGVQVTYVEGRVGDNFAKVQAGNQSGNQEIDVLLSNDSVDPIGRGQGLFQPLDPQLVPNIEKLAEKARRADGVGVLVMFTLVGLIYNEAELAARNLPAPTSWTDLWNPMYDCVIIADPSGGNGLKGFVAMNFVASGGDLYDIDATIEKLKAMGSHIVGIEGASEQVINDVSAGRGCLSVSNQGRALAAIDGGAPVEFILPEEGTSYIENPLQLVTGANSPVAGQLLINWLLDTPTQQELYETQAFTPMNTDVEPVTTGIAAAVTTADQLDTLNLMEADMATAPVDEWLRKFQSEVAQQ